jgi:hypothetical protein
MLGSWRTTGPVPSGTLIPWCQGRPFARTTGCLAPWTGRGPGDQVQWAAWVPSIQGAVPAGRASSTGYQGSKALRSPRDRYGKKVLTSWWRGHLGIKPIAESRWTREHGTWEPPEPRSPRDQVNRRASSTRSSMEQVGRFAIGDWVSRCHQPLVAAGIKAAVGPRSHGLYIRMPPWHPSGLQWPGSKVLYRTRCVEQLGRSPSWGPCRLRRVGAMRTLGAEATRDRSEPGTKVVDEVKVPSRRRTHQGKGPRWSMR